MNAGDGRHLLVIDDDDRIRDLIREYLVRAGFRVSAAPDAAAARRLVDQLSFDLLVLDVMMPGEDGFAFGKWLRSRPGDTGRTPMVILTARGQPDDRITGLSLGADDYLAKPFEPQELVLRIEAILRRTAPRAVAGAARACWTVHGEPPDHHGADGSRRRGDDAGGSSPTWAARRGRRRASRRARRRSRRGSRPRCP